MSMPASRTNVDAIAAYKKILKDILDLRPSGTRQRLAVAIGKNRSFVSQMANPSYAMPIPAQHLESMFEVCHFSEAQRKSFLEHYHNAHSGKLRLAAVRAATRRLMLDVPDFGDAERNAAFDTMLDGLIKQVLRLTDHKNNRR